mmetsp:Transcript_6128/g.17240  ORF Transcript_6128/g.17240 Transcript_6128/m.17240 type:complete len:298 (+) Transcript_6128:366-1259(+)
MGMKKKMMMMKGGGEGGGNEDEEVEDILEPGNQCYSNNINERVLDQNLCTSRALSTPIDLLLNVSEQYSSLDEIDAADEFDGGLDEVLEQLRPLFDLARQAMIEEYNAVEDAEAITEQEFLELVLWQGPQELDGAVLTADDFGGDVDQLNSCVSAVVGVVARAIGVFLCLMGLTTIGIKVGSAIAAQLRITNVFTGSIIGLWDLFRENVSRLGAELALAIFKFATTQLSIRTVAGTIWNELTWWDAIKIGASLVIIVLATLATKGMALALKATACLIALSFAIIDSVTAIVNNCPAP